MAEDNSYTGDTYDESAEYSPKSEFSKPKIVSMTVEKCIEARSKEMRSGYYNTNISKDGLPLRVWIQDTRKIYVSCVTALRQLLIPEILEDEKYKNKKDNEHPLKKIDEQMKEAQKDYAYYFFEKYMDGHKTKFKKTEKYIMPDIDDSVMIRKVYPDGNEELLSSSGRWNQYVNAYWDRLVQLNDILFQELMRVIHRKNYFKQGMSF